MGGCCGRRRRGLPLDDEQGHVLSPRPDSLPTTDDEEYERDETLVEPAPTCPVQDDEGYCLSPTSRRRRPRTYPSL